MVTIPPEPSNQHESGAPPATLGEALERVEQRLEESGLFYGHGTDNAWDEAVLLVLSAAGLPVAAGREVIDNTVTSAQWQRMVSLLQERVQKRRPLPYLLGRAWFAGLEFRCDERALVPRSPLAELVLDDYAPWWTGMPERRILDLCCGGGAIGIAAACYAPEARVTLADIDTNALALAAENIALHDLGARVGVCRSDLFAALPAERYDLILCNPPYVDARDLAEMPAEFRAEPELALGAGDDGLDIALRVLVEAGSHLAADGLLLLELGNSWVALDALLATLPLSWVEFREGGHGVLALRADELPAVRAAVLASARGAALRV